MHIKQEIRVQEPDDIYTELKKLKELLDNKVITQEEFDERKTQEEDSRKINVNFCKDNSCSSNES